MPRPGFNDYVKLGEHARDDLLEKLDSSASPIKDTRRLDDRFVYRLANIPVVIAQPDGVTGRFLVVTRNLSSGGVSFVHGSYIHAGSRCQIMLPKNAREAVMCKGETVSCRHISGMLHEIGVRFDKKIDIAEFPVDHTKPVPEEIASIELPSLSGIALLLCAKDLDAAAAISTALQTAGMSVVLAHSSEKALEHIDQDAPTMLICDAGLELPPPDEAAALYRDVGFSGDLIAFGPDSEPFEDAFNLACPSTEPGELLNAIAGMRPSDNGGENDGTESAKAA